MSYAFFNHAQVDVKDFSTALKLMIDNNYHSSGSAEVKAAAKKNLEQNFTNLLLLISKTSEGKVLADKVKAKLKVRTPYLIM